MKFSLLLTGLLCMSFPALAASPKNKQPQPPTLRQQMLGHVERILVVDSIAVDRDEFLSAFKIMPSTGKVLDAKEMSQRLAAIKMPDNFVGNPSTGFTNEFNDYMVWAQRDTTGHYRLAESVKLIDGTWSTPAFTPALLNEGRETEDRDDEETVEISADALYPFMSDDGQTLYFAANNDQSLGGLDIFVAAKDPSDGDFLIPGNMGLPFNSEFDDYMMVLDRETGVGWWATDRNQLGDLITIYVFALTDERENVDPDEENLEAFATLAGWQELIGGDDDIQKINILKKAVADIKPVTTKKPEFTLPMPGGVTYRFFSDFKNKKAANSMMLYLEEKANFDKKHLQLDALRRQYHAGNRQVSTRIQALEEELRETQSNLRVLLSEVYKAESN